MSNSSTHSSSSTRLPSPGTPASKGIHEDGMAILGSTDSALMTAVAEYSDHQKDRAGSLGDGFRLPVQAIIAQGRWSAT